MASVNALSVALFNAAAGGYSADMQANPAAYAAVAGAVLEKNLSSNAAFVQHLLANFGIASSNPVFAEAQTALTAMVNASGRANATVSAIDFLATVPRDNAFASVANAFFAKVDAAAAFSRANTTELDVSKLIAAVTGVDTDVVAANAAFANGAASRDSEVNGLQVSVTGLRAELAAAQAATTAATTAAATAKTAADAAAAKAAADLTAANNTIRLIDDTAFASESAAAKAAADTAAKVAADLKIVTDAAAKVAADRINALENPSGKATVLSVNADTVLGVTNGNDTITATNTTYTSNDLIIDASTTDSDVLNFTAAAGVTTTNNPTVVGIELLNFSFNSFVAPTVTAGGIRTGAITVNQTQTGAAGDATVSGINSVTVKGGANITGTLALNTVTADSNVIVDAGSAATVTVTTVAAGSVQVSGGALLNSVTLEGKSTSVTTAKPASSITILGTAATTDTAVISAGAATSLTIGGTAKEVETLTVSGNGVASVATVAPANAGTGPSTFIFAGSQNVTIKGEGADFTTKTFTDNSTATSTINVDGAGTLATTLDLSKAAVDAIIIADAVNTGGTALTFANNANVTFSEDLATTSKTLTLDINDQTTTNVTTGVLTLTLNKAQANGAIAFDATANSDNIATLNLVNNTVAQTGLNLTAGTPVTVNVSGSKDIVFTATSTAKAINAASATGAITVNYDNTNDIATVTGGSGADVFTNATTAIGTKVTINSGAGNDTFTMMSTAKAVIDGGGGYDKVTLVGDITGLEMSNVEELATSGAVTSALTSQLNGKSFVMSGANALTFGTAASNFNTSTIDLSLLTVNNVTGFTVDASNGLSTSLFTTATGATITGSSIADVIKGTNNSDTINGGAGIDVLTGNAGADIINGGAGGDIIYGDNSGAKSVAAFTITTEAAASKTITLNVHGVDVAVVTAGKSAGAGAAEIAAQALLIANEINAKAELKNLVSATNAAGVVTISSLVDGNTFGVVTTGAGVGTATGITIKESTSGSMVLADGADADATAQTLTTTAVAIEILASSAVVGALGSSATDTLTGGADSDIFVFNLNAAGAAPSATVFDTITDFATASDVIDFAPGNLTIVTNDVTATAGVAKITSAGVATFHANDTTLALKIVATEAGIQTGTPTLGQVAIFQDGADAYVFISDGVDGVGANDVLVKLVGVNTTATAFDTITLTNGNMTLA